jgi:hypothetical protein
MYLRNTSRYPTDEVRRLVDFATRGVSLTRASVHVKNTAFGLAGMAYFTIPRISSAHGGARSLITLRIGRAGFPRDNMVSTLKWGPWMALADLRALDLPASCAFAMRTVGGVEQARAGEPIRHPYGGKRSPLIVVNDWREALVAVAAHEARHIHQHRRKKPLSEVDCERFAAKALARYRAAGVN